MKITCCKLKRKHQLRLLEFFVLEVTARSAADMLGIQPNTAMLFYKKVRQVINHYVELQVHEIFDGAVELDESYFGGARKGKRGRGAAGKVVVFGILKRGGKIFTKVVNDTQAATLIPLITRKVAPDSLVYTDCYRSYNALDVSDFHHHRINHSALFARGRNHINGIENFWNQAKRVLRSTTGFQKSRSRYSSRNVSSDSITEHLNSNCKYSRSGPMFGANLLQPLNIWYRDSFTAPLIC